MRTLLYGYIAAIFGVVLLIDLGVLAGTSHWVQGFPMKDKGAHFLIAGTLALAANALLLRHMPTRPWLAVASGSVLVAAVMAVEELSNQITPYRAWSIKDLAANLLGVAVLGAAPMAAWLAMRPARPKATVAN
ncbi:MAG: hypothetical protein AAF589_00800 [Planctomycetota bacterium]